MRYAAIALVAATGLACAQIQPGTAAYDAVSAIANNQYLNAVNVSCDNFSAPRGSLCFDSGVSDQAFARQLVDESMQAYTPVGFWARNVAGAETKSWSLGGADGTLSVQIVPGANVELVISADEASGSQNSTTPLGSSPEPQSPSLQQVANDAAAQIQERIDESRYDCPSSMPNSVCFETTMSLSGLQSALDRVFAGTHPTDWQTSYTSSQTLVSAAYSYEGVHLFVVASSHGVALTSSCIVMAIH